MMFKQLKHIIVSNRWLTTIAIAINKFRIKKKFKLKYGNNVFIGYSVVTEGRNFFYDNCHITSSFIGYGSYLGEGTRISKAKIGRYTSIGPHVNCVFGRHPSNTFVSTHPVFFSTNKQMGFSYTDIPLFDEYAPNRDENDKYSILIGNDVWIGAHVTIMDGVSIGDGAIVASNALVNKDVPPYSIVGGVPAKIIKKRFSNDQIDFLLDLQWWNKPESWVGEHASLFVDIEKLYDKLKHE